MALMADPQVFCLILPLGSALIHFLSFYRLLRPIQSRFRHVVKVSPQVIIRAKPQVVSNRDVYPPDLYQYNKNFKAKKHA